MYEWIYFRIIKWTRFLFHGGERVSVADLRNQHYVKKMMETYGIREPAKFVLYDDNQINIGSKSSLGIGAWIWCHDKCDTGKVVGQGRGTLNVGLCVYIGSHFKADCYDVISIEDNCLLADEIQIFTSNHGMNPELEGSYADQPLETGKVIIQKGCWIGSRVTILPGVTVGEKAIIGTNSVVTKDIPPYSIAVGIPARVVKKWNFETHSWERV